MRLLMLPLKLMMLILRQTIVRQQQVNLLNIRQKFIGSTPADNNILDTEVVVPLKYLRASLGDFLICL